jgi:hypothetical protein
MLKPIQRLLRNTELLCVYKVASTVVIAWAGIHHLYELVRNIWLSSCVALNIAIRRCRKGYRWRACFIPSLVHSP